MLRLSLLGFLLAATSAARAQHTPASTPALPTEESQKKFVVPEGFEVRLFAAEPDVVNPVAMTWDERGRLWILELYEYPRGAPAGQKGRDRIKILEDTNGDGRADKVKVFADGFSLATGLLLGRGGVFVGQAPHFLFLKDTNGDDAADTRDILLTGFGMDDRHELLNGFAWGPDGWLYMTHGVFTYSQVKDPKDPKDDGVKINAAVARYHPEHKTFELFADGTSNPWGVDFDRAGNAFVTACVIDHLFHISPGGVYVRQAGTPGNPYVYDLLPSIVGHAHQRAAYCGVCVYQGDQYPEAYRGTILMGNIHGNCVNRDRLAPKGSTFRASAEPDFLKTDDGWFRPVSVQVGPDGALWIADWYDKYPCYQNAVADPGGVDRAHGRIWRVVYTGAEKGAPRPPRRGSENLAALSADKLVGLLSHANVWHRRTAQRLLSERRPSSVAPALKQLAAKGPALEARLAALWTLHGAGLLDDATLESLSKDPEPALRAWTARLTGERSSDAKSSRDAAAKSLPRLQRLAADPDATVRAAVAVAARRMAAADTVPVIAALAAQPVLADDPLLPFLIWRAAEPKAAKDPKPLLDWVLRDGAAAAPGCGPLLRNVMRRMCDARQAERINAAADFLGSLADRAPGLAAAAVEGLLAGQKEQPQRPSVSVSVALAKLAADPDAKAAERARQLAALWGVSGASENILAAIGDPKAAAAKRIEAILVARRLRTDAARDALLPVLAEAGHEAVVIEALRALGDIGGERVAAEALGHWKDYTPAMRRAAAEALASRASWAAALLKAVEEKAVDPADVPVSAHRALMQHEDPALRDLLARTLGRYRDTPKEKAKLISLKTQVVQKGPVDYEAGHALARKHCLVCHAFQGEGAKVGPDLTGVGRSSIQAILTNVIDPNQVIGKGYEQVIVNTKDERVLTGRLVEDSPERVTLLSSGPKEETVPRSEVSSVKVSDQSVMPEGLEQMPDDEFRNLIRYVFDAPKLPAEKTK